MTADQADHAAGCGIADRSDNGLDRTPRTAKREAMANSDLGSFGKTSVEGFANGPRIFPAQTSRDVHFSDFLRRNAKKRFKRRIYPFVRKSPPVRRAYCKEKIGCEHPVQPIARFFRTNSQPFSGAGSIRLAGWRAMQLHDTHSLFSNNSQY
jgi:hypothetical protein